MAAGEKSTGQSTKRKLIFGSRKSKLAMWQTHRVVDQLRAVHSELEVEIQEFSTVGDQQTEQPLPKIGGKGLFTAELDAALQAGEIDIAVHSLKDLPTQPTDRIAILPLLEREDPRDVLISKDKQKLSELKPGSTVGTSSYRRQSQLLALRPDLKVKSIRGNVPTRIAKVDTPEYDAVILAAAGVLRLEMNDMIADWFPLPDMLPAPGQGAVAATFREDNSEAIRLLDPLVDENTNQFVAAERMFLAAMGGGCSSPIAAHACHFETESNQITLTGRLSSVDGKSVITQSRSGIDIQEMANELANSILENGGNEILASLPVHTTN